MNFSNKSKDAFIFTYVKLTYWLRTSDKYKIKWSIFAYVSSIDNNMNLELFFQFVCIDCTVAGDSSSPIKVRYILQHIAVKQNWQSAETTLTPATIEKHA